MTDDQGLTGEGEGLRQQRPFSPSSAETTQRVPPLCAAKHPDGGMCFKEQGHAGKHETSALTNKREWEQGRD